MLSPKRISDQYGREMKKVRVSLLDACNYRCMYCMPSNKTFSPVEDILTAQELSEIVTGLMRFGLDEVRLTGGEPTLRSDFVEITQHLSTLPLKKLGITSNGHRLAKLLPLLPSSEKISFNMSLDSLNRENYLRITKVDGLNQTLESLFLAQELGYKVKINCVMMKGVNDHELLDFIQFSSTHKIEVRFLEVMKIGVAIPFFNQWFIPAKEIMKRLECFGKLLPRSQAKDATAFCFDLENGAKIGLIASESMPFCQHCSRLRLSAKGVLRSCLMKNEGISLRGVPLNQYADIIQEIANQKPFDRIEKVDQPMYQIGG